MLREFLDNGAIDLETLSPEETRKFLCECLDVLGEVNQENPGFLDAFISQPEGEDSVIPSVNVLISLRDTDKILAWEAMPNGLFQLQTRVRCLVGAEDDIVMIVRGRLIPDKQEFCWALLTPSPGKTRILAAGRSATLELGQKQADLALARLSPHVLSSYVPTPDTDGLREPFSRYGLLDDGTVFNTLPV
jgi:hypothetical protein